MELLKALGVAYITFSTIMFTLFLFGLVRSLRKAFSNKEKTVSKIADQIRLVYVEQIGGAVYMYDKLTNNFLLQAATEEELWSKAKIEYPQIQFFTTTKDADITEDA
jgi:hypothetical protein